MLIDRCRSCGAEIFWVKTQAGKHMPIDAQQRIGDGNVVLDPQMGHAVIVGKGEGRYISHFATCPHAAAHRRSKDKRKAGGGS